jgi:phenylacetate-CoA ligase
MDGIKGAPIRCHYDDIVAKMSSDDDSIDQLAVILNHATRTTPFYLRYSANDLQALPVVSRRTYKNDFNEFQSRDYLGLPVYRINTSGSSGIPFAMGQDSAKRSRVVAEVLYFNHIYGYRLGDLLMWLRGWSTVPTKTRMARFAQNIIPIEVIGMDDRVRRDTVLTLRRQRPVPSSALQMHPRLPFNARVAGPICRRRGLRWP